MMAYHHRHLSSIENLESELDKIGMERFVKKYTKYPIIGETDSIKFILKIKKLWDIINTDGGQKEKDTNP